MSGCSLILSICDVMTCGDSSNSAKNKVFFRQNKAPLALRLAAILPDGLSL